MDNDDPFSKHIFHKTDNDELDQVSKSYIIYMIQIKNFPCIQEEFMESVLVSLN